MDIKLLVTVFVTVFAAEIADKTQIATLLYATNAPHSRITVFLGSAAALTLSSGIAVLAGSAVTQWFHPKALSLLAGTAFLAVGIWTILRGL